MQLSKPETYLFFSAATLGAFTFLHGAYNLDEINMDIGKNLMAFAMTYYVTDNSYARFSTFLGAASCMFWRGDTSAANTVCGLTAGAAAMKYVYTLSQGGEPTRLTF